MIGEGARPHRGPGVSDEESARALLVARRLFFPPFRSPFPGAQHVFVGGSPRILAQRGFGGP